ncbi:MAG: Kelch repeat-containing protein [Planctomycetota bacterium JB042]
MIDPANNFQSTPVANTMAMPRALHGASLLPDGRVLVTGGTSSFMSPADIVQNSTKSTEFYDPQTNMFSAGPNMAVPRVGQTTTTLDNGQVLIAGGFSFVLVLGFPVPFVTDDAQVYTPAAGGLGTFGSPILMTQDRFAHNAIKKSDGKVLLFGGAQDVFSDPFNPVATSTVEEFDPSTGQFQFHGTMSVARGGCAVTLLPNDVVIVAGGAYGSINLPIPDATLDVYNGNSGLQATVQMQHVRGYFTATALPNGAVLLAGGGEEGTAPNELAFDDAELLTIP